MIFLSIYKQVYVGALVEKSKSANIGFMYSNIMLLLTIFFRASKKPSLLFSQSVHPACILNNMPICAPPPFTCSHTASKKESQSVSRISEP